MYKTNLNYSDSCGTQGVRSPVVKTITFYNDVEQWSVNGAVKAFEKIVETNDSKVELIDIATYDLN